jgi:hypothetical protein
MSEANEAIIRDLCKTIEGQVKVIQEQRKEIERLRNALEISCGARELANQETERLRESAENMAANAAAFADIAREKDSEIEQLRKVIAIWERRI